MSIVVDVLLVVLALPFLGSGVMKIVGASAMRSSADHLGLSFSSYRLIGVLEVLGAAGLLVGIAWRPAAIAAAVGLALLMVGAIGYHRRAHDAPGEIAPPVVLGVLSLAGAVLAALSL